VSEQQAADPIETGLRAWQAGDLDALEGVLAGDVSLRAVQPGPWDCIGRDDVMRLLRRRAAERGNRPPTAVHVQRVDEHTYVVRSDEPGPDPFPVATRVTVTGGRVTAMQQIRAEAAGV
jgi:ketosteroid isomerase-like protein